MKLCLTCRHCFEDEDLSCPQHQNTSLITKRAGTCLINNRYHLDQLLGEGRMGAVFKCTDLQLNRACAIKVLRPDSAEADPNGRHRLKREALTACRFRHPNLIQVYDSGSNFVQIEEEDGTHIYDELYVVMELLEGQTLRDYLGRHQRLTIVEAVEIARQIVVGLAEVHSKGIVHRDLKPANIMLTSDYKGDLLVKIVDFGAVKFTQRHSAIDDLELTGAMIVGSALYTSPENCRGEPLAEQSDLYCLGLILFEMIAGRRPFNSRGRADLIHQHAYVDAPSLDEIVDNVPDELVHLVKNLLDKDPEKRPQSTQLLRQFVKFSSSNELSHLTYAEDIQKATEFEFGADEETRIRIAPSPNILAEAESVRTDLLHANILSLEDLSDSAASDENANSKDDVPSEPIDTVVTMPIHQVNDRKRIVVATVGFIVFLFASGFFSWSMLSKGPQAARAETAAEVAENRQGSNGIEVLITTDVNIRDEPSSSGQIIGLAESGSRLQILSKRGNWYQIIVLQHGRSKKSEASEDKGWVNATYLTGV
jgi:serine/threonine protein kinase